MTILEALKELTQSIIDWVSNKISKEKEEIQKELNEKIAEIQPADGMSAFEIALQNGFDGTEQEWLASLKGESAQIYVGTGDMPDGYAIQIDPTDDTRVVTSVNGVWPDENGNVVIEGGSGGSGADGYSPTANVVQTDSGTIITITDKTGTTTATIKDGKDGADGYTPARGVDYWTNADKAEIKAYVDEAILGGAW